jgi:tetratricopeptide (TPR) repeat protein
MKNFLLSALVTAGLLSYLGVLSWSWAAERHYQRGEDFERAGELARAGTEFEAARELLPTCADYQRAAGRVSLAQWGTTAESGRDLRLLFQAKDAQQKARAADPLYPYHDFELGLVLFTMRRAGLDHQPSPEPYFRRALELDPGNPRFMAGWIRWESSQGKAEAAWSDFVKLVRLHPAVIRDFGPDMLRDDRDYERFGADLGRDPRANLEYAAYLYERKQYALAEKRIRLIPASSWSDEAAAGIVARVMIVQGHPEEAEQTLREAVVKAPDNLNLWTTLGPLLIRREKFPDAVEIYQRALHYHPGYQSFLLGLADAAEKAGQPELALENYRRAINLGGLGPPQRKKVFTRMAEIHEGQGSLEAALGAYRQAQELDPDDRELALKIDVLTFQLSRAKPRVP